MKTATLFILISKVAHEGALEIPKSDWDEISLLIRDFGTSFMLHDHNSAGAYHGLPDVHCGPHYMLEIDVDEKKKAQLLAAVMPLIEDIVVRNRRDIAVRAGT